MGDNSSPWGENAVCTWSHTIYTAGCAKSLSATYQYKISNPSNKLLVTNILTNNLWANRAHYINYLMVNNQY
jgi:hypothetical protein